MKRTSYCYWILAAAVALALNGCSGGTPATATPGKPAAEWISEGDKLLADNRLDDALAAFDSAVDSDSGSAEALQRRGLAYLRLDKLDKAIDDCNAALKINGKLADGFYTRG